MIQSGGSELEVTQHGYLAPRPAYWRLYLQRPELQVVEESCAAERALHARLLEEPLATVPEHNLTALADPDVQHNYRLFLSFRDAVQTAGSLETYYVQLMRSGVHDVPPVFIQQLVQAIVRQMLGAHPPSLLVRAAELLFRTQRVAVTDGRIIAGDAEALDEWRATGGLGDFGRLLLQNQISLGQDALKVLGGDNQEAFLADTQSPRYRYRWLLDLTLQMQSSVGVGAHQWDMVLARSDSGLVALSKVLALWVSHMLGVKVRISPLASVQDHRWRWHTGLDSTSSALLNDLYEQREVSDERLALLISLFRLEFEDASSVRPDLAGAPVYLGLAMDEQGLLKLKPQNLLLNLPLAVSQ